MSINKILIIGSNGQMGRLLVRCSRKAGFFVTEADQPLSSQILAQKAAGMDLIILAVPAHAMESVLALLAPALNKKQILTDICSVKVRPVSAMLKAFNGAVAGTHPLFGPKTSCQNRRIAITPGRKPEAVNIVTDFMQRLGFETFTTSAKEHDEAMAAIQGLNFVTTVSYLSTLTNIAQIEKFLTPSFLRRLEAAKKMVTEDSELFSGLLEANPYTLSTVRKYRTMLSLAAGGDTDLLAQRAKQWWIDDKNIKKT